MILQETVHNFRTVGKLNLEEIYKDCIEDFSEKIIDMIKANIDNIEDFNIREHMGLENYKKFDNLGRRITYNSKGVEFKELYTTIVKPDTLTYLTDYNKEIIANSGIRPDRENLSVMIANLLVDDYNKGMETTENTERVPALSHYFGYGEFPYMDITVVRIGNILYYFYQITR